MKRNYHEYLSHQLVKRMMYKSLAGATWWQSGKERRVWNLWMGVGQMAGKNVWRHMPCHIHAPCGSKDPLCLADCREVLFGGQLLPTPLGSGRQSVTSRRVPKLWRTVNTSELMMNSLASTPVGRTPPRFSAALSAPGGQLLWRCVHWSINCSSQLGILESSAPWQSGKGVPKIAAHRDQLEGFSTFSFWLPPPDI